MPVSYFLQHTADHVAPANRPLPLAALGCRRAGRIRLSGLRRHSTGFRAMMVRVLVKAAAMLVRSLEWGGEAISLGVAGSGGAPISNGAGCASPASSTSQPIA
jgi:hypothetical protein